MTSRWKFAEEDRTLLVRELRIDFLFSLSFIVGIYALFVRVASHIVEASLTIGDLSIFMGVTVRLQNSLRNLVEGAVGLVEESLYISNLHDYFAIQPWLQDQAAPKDSAVLRGEIEIDNLSFAYPGSAAYVFSPTYPAHLAR